MKTDKIINGQIDYDFCLLGASLGTSNMGVSALAASMIKIVKNIHVNANISLLIGNKSSEEQLLKMTDDNIWRVKVVNFRLSPKSKLNEHLFWIFFMAVLWRILPLESIKRTIINHTPWLKSVIQSNMIGDIRGGDSFSDIYGLTRLIIGSIPDLIVLIMKKNLVLLPQTYGPYKSIIGQTIAKIILKQSSQILSRDRDGIEYIMKIIGNYNTNKKVIFCPDVAFMLDSITPKNIKIEPQINHDLNVPLIGFNVNGLMYNGGYTRDNMFGLKLDYKKFSIDIALTLLENTDAHILFIPHTYSPEVESDPDACKDVMNSLDEKYKNRIHIVASEYDQSEIKGIIRLCDFFIGSRMHACIAALSQGIPTVGVAYSRKFVGVFESIGVGNLVADARSLSEDEIIGKILLDYRNRTAFKEKLSNINNAIIKIQETFSKLLNT